MTTLGAATGRTEVRTCAACGINVSHTEARYQAPTGGRGTAWLPARHVAPCGQPCILGVGLFGGITSSHHTVECPRCRFRRSNGTRTG